jgi:hypothetical protein
MIMESSAHQPELVHLSLADLDVQELEQRMELASAAPAADCWANACGVNDG